jgi:hypothetical protein
MNKDIDQKFDIFISHSREDTQVAKELARRLEQENLLVFWDQDVGDNWTSVLRRKIESARSYLLLISPSALQNRNCRNEWAEIQERVWSDKNSKVYSLIAEGCTEPSFIKTMLLRNAETIESHTKKPDRIAVLLDKDVPGLNKWHLMFFDKTKRHHFDTKDELLDQRSERFQHLVSVIKEDSNDSEAKHAETNQSPKE